MATHLEFEQWVPFPVEKVFEFFSNPENLPRIMPDASATQLVSLNRVAPPETSSPSAAGVGSTIVTSFRVVPFLPFRATWIARINEFQRNHHFADVQYKGPFKSWHHRHELIPQIRDSVTGTLVRDIIDYVVGFGWLGALVDSVFVRRQMEATFRERQQKLPLLLRE